MGARTVPSVLPVIHRPTRSAIFVSGCGPASVMSVRVPTHAGALHQILGQRDSLSIGQRRGRAGRRRGQARLLVTIRSGKQRLNDRGLTGIEIDPARRHASGR